jgi:hypothetical protein
MVFIYILKLQKEKYYIGKTNNPDFRLNDHFNSNASSWTTKYTPIQLLKLIPNCDDYDEDKYTRIYMDKYGIDNVRGGSFTMIKLDNASKMCLKQMSNGTNDKCFKCEEKGHFAKDCHNSSEDDYVDSSDTDDSSSDDNKNNKSYVDMFLNIVSLIISDDDDEKCSRCGRKGHKKSHCYASKHIKGYYLKKNYK